MTTMSILDEIIDKKRPEEEKGHRCQCLYCKVRMSEGDPHYLCLPCRVCLYRCSPACEACDFLRCNPHMDKNVSRLHRDRLVRLKQSGYTDHLGRCWEFEYVTDKSEWEKVRSAGKVEFTWSAYPELCSSDIPLVANPPPFVPGGGEKRKTKREGLTTPRMGSKLESRRTMLASDGHPERGGPGSVVMPPHPGSGQSDSRNSSMHAPGYPSGAPPHMPGGPPPPSGPHGYPTKMGHLPPGPPYCQTGYQQGPGSHQYPPSRPQGPMMQSYSQNFPPGAPQGPPSSMASSHQYSPRPHNNHVPPSQYGYSHYGQQSWVQGMGQGPPGGMPGGPNMMPGGPGGPAGPGMPSKAAPGQIPGQSSQPGTNSVGGPRAHTPPHYMKQMPHKIALYPPGAPPPTCPQMYPNGPGLPGLPNNRESPQNNMPPPTSTPQPLTPSNAAVDGDHVGGVGGSMNSNSSGSSSSNPPSVGPDGNPIVDEASQQSTVSNNSAASGDDRAATPKPPKEQSIAMNLQSGGMVGCPGGQHPSSHPATPINSAPSPGAASMTSQQDEFENMNSPGWPRSPTAPNVYANSQPPPPPDIYRPTKPGDSITRLYEMSDSPVRRAWLDKLLSFMEENKTPITACPTISKNPLDLYALYLHVQERGGFLEVTKNKQWKDVAAVMGIGASSSGSYTLRKHYMKHILAYECKFDRGGIDPQPIINQIEASAKKKSSKTLSVPSPGSSNSQDSFPPPCSNSSSMDGYANGPHLGGPGMPGSYPQYPPSTEYAAHMQQRPPPHSTPGGFQGYQGGQYPGYQGMHGGYGQTGYPNSGYPPDSRGYQPPGPSNHQGNFQGYQQPGGYQRPGYPPNQPGYPQEQYSISTSSSNYGSSQLAKQLLNPVRNTGPVMQGYQGSSMYPSPQKPGAAQSPGPQPPPSSPAYQGPRRHPDFEKSQPGWRNNSQFGNFSSPAGQTTSPQPWNRPSDSTPSSGPPPQWNQPPRFPPQQSQPFPTQRWSGSSFTTGVPARPPGPVSNNKNYLVPPTSFKSGGYGPYMGKQLFPVDSIEAVTPVQARRKRMARADIHPVDPWKLLMALRCGLAAEVTWALDILNILLFDDSTVVFFSLHHMPGLLEALIEHLRRGLINMFDICSELELGRDDEATGANKRIKAEQHDGDRPWYEMPPPSPPLELDLGHVEEVEDADDKEVILKDAPDHTLETRTGKIVKFVKREGELFLREGSREWDKWEGFDSGVDTWSVGGGECTAHIICSMQSTVCPLPFTHLLPSKHTIFRETEPPSVGLEKDVVKLEVDVSEVKSVKEENVQGNCESIEGKKVEGDIVNSEDKNVVCKEPVVSSNDATNVSKDRQEVVASEKCSGPKDFLMKSSAHSQKVNRLNNAKTNKLDKILKRIKKEPIIPSEAAAEMQSAERDSKRILDMCLVKSETASETDSPTINPVKVERLEPIPEEEKVSEKLNVDKVESESKSEKVASMDDVNKEKVAKIERLQKADTISIERLQRRESSGSRRESGGFKRPYEDLEEESWSPDEASLTTTTEAQDWLARRVICIGTVIRNLSFIPGNEDLMSRSASLLALLGNTVLLHHNHPPRSPSTAHYDRDEDGDMSDWCSSLAPDIFWWWPYLHHIHENTLVTLANMAGHLDLSYYPEEISRPLLNGLLHWATCPSSYGQDPLPGGGAAGPSALSPQRLALEALVKLCVLDQNTDLVLATPPFFRLDMLCSQLTRSVCRGEDQVLREFAMNLLNYFAAADSGVARVIAMQNGCVSHIVSFIEEAEDAAFNVANIQGVVALKEKPELMGTSLDMVRRAASTLIHLSRVPDNARVLAACEDRLLKLVMSQILDTHVASQLSQVLYNVAQVQSIYPPPPPPPPPSSPPVSLVVNQDEETKNSIRCIQPACENSTSESAGESCTTTEPHGDIPHSSETSEEASVELSKNELGSEESSGSSSTISENSVTSDAGMVTSEPQPAVSYDSNPTIASSGSKAVVTPMS